MAADMRPYTRGFRARMVQRMAGAEGITATELAREVGVGQSTLSRWLRQAPNLEPMGRRKKTGRDAGPGGGRRGWSAEEKLRIVMEAAALPDEELGAFLRREGLHEAQLEEWRSKVTEAATGALKDAKKRRSDRTPEARKIRKLERELRHKEKALAELAALLMLKKKAEEIWGAGDDDTGTRSET